MNCLQNINKNKIPNDIIMLYLKLYQFKGRNKEMIGAVENDYDTLVLETIRTDSYFLAKFLDLGINESRYKSILLRNVQPKNKDERLLRNIKNALIRIHEESHEFELIDREIHDLLKFLYGDVTNNDLLHFSKVNQSKKEKINLLSSGHKTKREALEALVNAYHHTKKHSDYEASFIILNFVVDFLLLKPFKAHNEELGIMLLYILLMSEGIESFHLSSFFEKLYKQRERFLKLRQEVAHNWADGMSDTHNLHRFILKIAIESYQDVTEMLRNYTFDQQLNKGDYIENTINKLDEVFTKDEIRYQHPTISDSTINRTLKRLRDEKKIRPLGKGRSAKWMKLYQSPKKNNIHEQLNLKL